MSWHNMKKSIVALLAVMVCHYVVASEVTSEQALLVANAWAKANNSSFGVLGNAVKAVAQRDSDGVLLWYLVDMANGGTIVTAGDNRLEPVIAVLANQSFTDGVPRDSPLFGFMCEDVRSRLRSVNGTSRKVALQSVVIGGNTDNATAKACKAKWVKWLRKGSELQGAYNTLAGAPAMLFSFLPGFYNGLLTHWNQSGEAELGGVPSYNYYTPHHYVCGCVATAGATVLQYFNVTNGPTGITKTCAVNGRPTELTTLGGEYDWSILPKSMGGEASDPQQYVLTEKQRELLGRVTYDMGVLLNMNYNNNGESSGTYSYELPYAFKMMGLKTAKFVKFDGDAEENDQELWERYIYAQLRCDRPVILGIEGDLGGHEVVAVGYGEDALDTAYTRIFMGWAGSGDAWYNLPNIYELDIVAECVSDLSMDGNCVPVCGRVTTKVNDGTYPVGVVGVPVTVAYVKEAGSGLVTNTTTVFTGANGAYAALMPQGSWGFVTVDGVTHDDSFGMLPVEFVEEISETVTNGLEVTLAKYQNCLVNCDIESEYWDLSQKLDYVIAFYRQEGYGQKYDALLGEMSQTMLDTLQNLYALSDKALFENDEETYDEVNEVIDDLEVENSRLSGLYLTENGLYDFEVAEDFGVIDWPYSTEAAQAAQRRNKMVMLLSLDDDEPGSEAIKEFIATNSALIAENFEVYVADNTRDTEGLSFAVPAVGIFNSAVFSSELGWSVKNGMLGIWNNGGVPTEEELLNLVTSTAEAWDRLLNESAVLKLDGCSLYYDKKLGYLQATAAGGYSQELGVYSLTNGEEFVCKVPNIYTNETDGVVSKCMGWVLVEGTNMTAQQVWKDLNSAKVYAELEMDYVNLYKYLEESTTAQKNVAKINIANPAVTLVWLWQDTAYRVEVSEFLENTERTDLGRVNIDLAWVKPCSTNDFVAEGLVSGALIGELKAWQYYDPVKSEWMTVKSDSSEESNAEESLLVAQVTAPTAYRAMMSKNYLYKTGSHTLSIGVEPAELATLSDFPKPMYGKTELVYGDNSLYAIKTAVMMDNSRYVDSTGGVWVCTGWTNGVGSVAITGDVAKVAFDLNQDSAITWLWQLSEEEQPEDPEPLDLAVVWNDTLDNLHTGENVLVNASDLPSNFKLEDYSVDDVSTFSPWQVTDLKLDDSGNLVAVLAVDETVLIPKGVGSDVPLTIYYNDGFETVTVKAALSNGVKGFWYALYTTKQLGSKWEVVTTGYETGTPVKQATEDGPIEVSIIVTPEDVSRFYKLVISEKAPMVN